MVEFEEFFDYFFECYFEISVFFGILESVCLLIDEVICVGVDEVVCLIDFGVDDDFVFESFEFLKEFRVVLVS